MTKLAIPRCAILGASGHGKVIADMAELNGFMKIDFFDDDWPQLTTLYHWAILGDFSSLLEVAHDYDLIVVAIGNNATRLQKILLLLKAGAILKPLIHPNAAVSRYASLGVGTVVMANAVINAFANVGKGCIINTASSIDHDCILSDGVHISPGANLAGSVNVGQLSWVGIGAQIKQLITVGNEAVVGAGATVIRDVPNYKTVVGTPAVIISH
ncbi:sugar O-acyltransferase (sialic acid O-acetyltransferase NeuD family) [Aeromonas sp. BIGb0405]|uniref:acetyltransferase n=1 Tax=Aeromonas sp. BIGb0405 TaxID=2940592 RepID=UPI002167E0DD|nr:acetyltransferase [Aeromonas sp. BIGb0405]MCS3455408.1 sugar O-acyltransferase (sialic acid O-acetyltransferase NeuD family) [Aeromonas sp. BIGb0405]